MKAPEHDLSFCATHRPALSYWKSLFFGPLSEIAPEDRGRYLVEGPGHCTECHAPQNLLEGLSSLTLTGNARDPDGEAVPGISQAKLEAWALEDLTLFLEVGMTPSGDSTGGQMASVIEHSTCLLSEDDRVAIGRYLFPRAGANSDTAKDRASVWCAEDPRSARDEAMSGQAIATASCNDPVADQFALGVSMQIQCTPAIILDNGDIISGFIPPAALIPRAIEATGR